MDNNLSERESVLARPVRYRELSAAIKYDQKVKSRGLIRTISLKLELNTLKKALSRVTGDHVLDCPCGTGRIHQILQDKFSWVTSMDSSEAMLQVLRQTLGAERVCSGDIFNLPFSNEEFDWVISYRIFHHIQVPEQRVEMLQSIARVCRQGVMFTAWIDTPVNVRRSSRRCSLPLQEIEQVVHNAGLRVKNIDYVSWPFQPKSLITCTR